VRSGSRIITASLIGTGLFTVVATGAAIWPATLDLVAFVVSVVLFAIGVVLFVLAYGVAVVRSREEEIAVTSLFFLAGSAPARVRWQLLGSIGVEVVVAAVTAAVRPFTSLAAGVLVPVYGLGLSGLWGARSGRFPPRTHTERASSPRRT
jgi:hypothetical protein